MLSDPCHISWIKERSRGRASDGLICRSREHTRGTSLHASHSAQPRRLWLSYLLQNPARSSAASYQLFRLPWEGCFQGNDPYTQSPLGSKQVCSVTSHKCTTDVHRPTCVRIRGTVTQRPNRHLVHLCRCQGRQGPVSLGAQSRWCWCSKALWRS